MPLSSKNWKILEMWVGQRRIINPKGLGPVFSLCRRAGTDAAVVKAQFSFRRCTPPIENKIEQTIQTLRWRLAKVEFGTARVFELISRHPIFNFGVPLMLHQMPLLHNGTQREHEDLSSNAP